MELSDLPGWKERLVAEEEAQLQVQGGCDANDRNSKRWALASGSWKTCEQNNGQYGLKV